VTSGQGSRVEPLSTAIRTALDTMGLLWARLVRVVTLRAFTGAALLPVRLAAPIRPHAAHALDEPIPNAAVPRRKVGDLAVLGVALTLGAVLRFLNLGGVGLNSDEAVYAAQAASMAGNPNYTNLFPVVRAHPVLFQALISPFYRNGTPDVPGRYFSAAFGMGTIGLLFLLGVIMYGRRVAAIAALLLAVMPYHVIISRQILLDGPMTFFTTASLVCMAAFGRTDRRRWLVAAGACLGLSALCKETAIILAGSIFVFLSLVSRFWRPVRYVIAAAAATVGLALTYPLVTAVSGGGRSGQSYLLWQLTRRPNHSFTFYVTTIPRMMGLVVVVVAAAGVVLLRRNNSWREALLLSWIAVPFIFFEVWPVKGFPYLMATTPAIALLAARPLGWLASRQAGKRFTKLIAAAAISVCTISLLIPAFHDLTNPSSSGLAGAGGTPGGRQAGRWVAANVPDGAQLMTIGPSMANLLQYYSGRRSDGLSVSPNPLHRNPSYHPILNPDSALRSGKYQYIVWDAYSAARSPSFGAKTLELVHRFSGRVVHIESASFGGKSSQPVIIIYQVRP
jgi:hypothetical protein